MYYLALSIDNGNYEAIRNWLYQSIDEVSLFKCSDGKWIDISEIEEIKPEHELKPYGLRFWGQINSQKRVSLIELRIQDTKPVLIKGECKDEAKEYAIRIIKLLKNGFNTNELSPEASLEYCLTVNDTGGKKVATVDQNRETVGMEIRIKPDSTTQGVISRVINATRTLPAQFTYYTACILAIYFSLSDPKILIAGIGANLLSDLVDRLLKKEELTDDEIKQIVQEVIKESEIESHLTSDEFQRTTARLVHRLYIMGNAIRDGDQEIVQRIKEQSKKFEISHEEIIQGQKSIHQKLDTLATSDQSEEMKESLSHINSLLEDHIGSSPTTSNTVELLNHERRIFETLDAILSEDELYIFIGELWSGDSYWHSQSIPINKFIDKANRSSLSFISEDLMQLTTKFVHTLEELQDFIALNFYMYPDKPEYYENPRSKLQPWLHGKEYTNYSRKLKELLRNVENSYTEYRMAVKEKLFI